MRFRVYGFQGLGVGVPSANTTYFFWYPVLFVKKSCATLRPLSPENLPKSRVPKWYRISFIHRFQISIPGGVFDRRGRKGDVSSSGLSCLSYP